MSTGDTVEGVWNEYCAHSTVPRRGHQSKYDAGSSDDRGSSPSLMARGLRRAGDVVTVAVVAAVGHGVGLATASVAASQTIICPRPRFAHMAYGIAMKSCSAFVTLPFASYARPYARPVITWTPLSRFGRNSLASVALSGSTMFRTVPFGLSGHSAAYTIGPRCSATRFRSASTFSCAATRRTGIGRS